MDKSFYYVDFSNRDNLTTEQKKALEQIQLLYFPLERATFLIDYLAEQSITNDDYSIMTGIPVPL